MLLLHVAAPTGITKTSLTVGKRSVDEIESAKHCRVVAAKVNRHVVRGRRHVAKGLHAARLVEQSLVRHVGTVVNGEDVDACPSQCLLDLDAVEEQEDLLV